MANDNKRLTEEEEQSIALKNSGVTIAVNILLSIFKLAVGIIGRSAAMAADAVHSFSDVFSTVIVVMGFKRIQSKGSDKAENAAGIVFSAVLGIAGICIGWFAVKDISGGFTGWISVPAKIVLIAAVVSVVVKEAMFWYTRAAAKKTDSEALMADAWHHRADAFSSVGSFAGVLMARLGYPVMDSVAALIICLFVLKAAFDLFMEALDKINNKELGEQTVEVLKKLVMQDERIIRVDELDGRVSGSRCVIDIEVSADGSMTLFEANEISESIHDRIDKVFPQVDRCMVRVMPEKVEDNS